MLSTDYRITADGVINTTHERIAEILHDYDPSLELAWIPPAQREPGDKPFVVVVNESNGSRYPLFYLEENEMDHRVLARVFQDDLRRNGGLLDWMSAQDQARQIMLAKQNEDAMAEARDLAGHILRSKKHLYRHNGKRFE